MSEIQIFNNPQFGEIRTAGTSENPLFCLSDLCKCLGLSAKFVNQRLSDEVVSNNPITDRLGRTQNALFVNEDGLYDVILDSRKPEARAFRKWVTGEVLPSIRKTGSYIPDDYYIDTSNVTRKDLAAVILESEEDLKAQDKIIEEQKVQIKELKEMLEQEQKEKINARFERLEELVMKMAEAMAKNMQPAPSLPETVSTDTEEIKEGNQPMLVHEMRIRIKEERGIIIPYPKMFSLLSRMRWIIRNDRYINKPAPVAVSKGYVLQSDSKGVKDNKHFYTIRVTEKGYRKFVDEVIGKGGLL